MKGAEQFSMYLLTICTSYFLCSFLLFRFLRSLYSNNWFPVGCPSLSTPTASFVRSFYTGSRIPCYSQKYKQRGEGAIVWSTHMKSVESDSFPVQEGWQVLEAYVGDGDLSFVSLMPLDSIPLKKIKMAFCHNKNSIVLKKGNL